MQVEDADKKLSRLGNGINDPAGFLKLIDNTEAMIRSQLTTRDTELAKLEAAEQDTRTPVILHA